MKLSKEKVEETEQFMNRQELKRLENEADRYALAMMQAIVKTEHAEQNLRVSLSVADSAKEDLSRANSRFVIAKAAYLKAKLEVAA